MNRTLIPWNSLALAAAALTVAAAPGLAPALVLQRDALLEGELWRLWTGHLVHGSTYHLWWNVLPLIGLGLFYEAALGRRMWGLLLIGAPVVGGGIVLLAPDLPSYCGLSGVLNTIWVGGALLSARREAGRMSHFYWGCAFVGLAKIGVEAWIGRPLFTDVSALGGSPVPLAHALGLLGGVVWWTGARRRAGRMIRQQPCPDRLGSVQYRDRISHELIQIQEPVFRRTPQPGAGLLQ